MDPTGLACSGAPCYDGTCICGVTACGLACEITNTTCDLFACPDGYYGEGRPLSGELRTRTCLRTPSGTVPDVQPNTNPSPGRVSRWRPARTSPDTLRVPDTGQPVVIGRHQGPWYCQVQVSEEEGCLASSRAFLLPVMMVTSSGG